MATSLTDEQKTQLSKWIADGASLADVQKRLAADFGVSLTYMDTRFLLDDLNLAIKDKPAAVTAASADLSKGPAPEASAPLGAPGDTAKPGGVKVVVDKIVRPGAVVSGSVTFSDGQTAEWYLDQTGRLGLVPKTKGYQPKPADVQEFQYSLQDELAKMGY